MLIFDTRLHRADQPLVSATPPAIASNTFLVDESWDIGNAFLWVGNYAKSQGGLDVLSIMCHGFYQWEENENVQASIAVGGYGLQLCKQGLVPATVPVVIANITGVVKNIVIYACGAAGQQSNNFVAQLMWAKISTSTGATIFAADRKQVYTTPGGIANFGSWEGTVWQYNPDGSVVPAATYPSPNPT